MAISLFKIKPPSFLFSIKHIPTQLPFLRSPNFSPICFLTQSSEASEAELLLSSSWVHSRLCSSSSVSFSYDTPSASNSSGLDILSSTAFHELATATKDFREANLIGEGGSGKVYKGHFADSQEIAVKRLNSDAILDHRLFRVEVLILCSLGHPNLVKLIGYCVEGEDRLLVYGYMPKGSLADHLYGKSTVPVLDWNTRMKIAVGAAKGIEYLHCSADPPVIYRDLKSANILLDHKFNPCLSDLGITTTDVMGSCGYYAPEYAMTGKLTIQSDIYSFDVVLLELLTGRKVIDPSKNQEEQSLVAWSQPFIQDRTRSLEMMDARLERRFPEEDAQHLIALIALSLNEKPKARPTISEIVAALEDLAAPSSTSDDEF